MHGLLSSRDLPWSERKRLVQQGQLQRVTRGVYATGSPPSDPGQRWRWDLAVAVLSQPAGVVVARSAAASLWGFDGFEPPTEIGLNASPNGSSRRSGTRRVRVLEPSVWLDGFEVTGASQTLLELGTGLRARRASPNDPRPARPDELVELAVESALRSGVVTEVELLDLLTSCGAQRGGSQLLQRVLERRPFGAPATESYLETRGVQLLRRAGLPTGQRQVAIADDQGRHIRRVDLLLEGRVIVEFDGEAHHSFEADHEAWTRLAATGLTLLVFTYQQVTGRPRFVADQVDRALRSPGLPGAAVPAGSPRRRQRTSQPTRQRPGEAR